MMQANIEQAPQKRRRKFRREPERRHIELRERDLDILAAVATHRFLNTEQVVAIFACACPRVEKIGVRGGLLAPIWVKQHRPNCACSCGAGEGKRTHAAGCVALFKKDKYVAARCTELFHAGYLERPVAQLQLRVREGVLALGSVPMVYSISKQGVEAIGEARRRAIGHGKLSWVGKINEGTTRIFMEHTLAIADASIGIDLSLRRRPGVVRLSEAELQAGMPAARRASPWPWSLHTRYKGTELAAVCDLAVALAEPETGRRWNFLIEVDRGHMPVERKGLGQTSILRKLIAYAKAHADELHRSALGWQDGFRVVILTTSEARVATCVAACRKRFAEAPGVARLFLFATLAASRDMLGASFTDGTGRKLRLIDRA